MWLSTWCKPLRDINTIQYNTIQYNTIQYNTIQLYCQVSIQLHEECFVVPSTLITCMYPLQSQNIIKLKQQQINILVKSHS